MPKWSRVSTSCILLASLLLPSAVQADKLKVQLEGVPRLDLALEMELNSVAGVWFPMAMARDMQADIEELKELRPMVKLQQRQLDVRSERIKLLKEALELTQEAATTSKSVVESAVRAQREAEEDEDSLFAGQPGLWALAGAAVTGILFAVLK